MDLHRLKLPWSLAIWEGKEVADAETTEAEAAEMDDALNEDSAEAAEAAEIDDDPTTDAAEAAELEDSREPNDAKAAETAKMVDAVDPDAAGAAEAAGMDDALEIDSTEVIPATVEVDVDLLPGLPLSGTAREIEFGWKCYKVTDSSWRSLKCSTLTFQP